MAQQHVPNTHPTTPQRRPPASPLAPLKSLTRTWPGRIGLGCAGLLLASCVCSGMLALAFGGTTSASTSTASGQVAQQQVGQQATVAPTVTPKPTVKPKVKATAKPTAKATCIPGAVNCNPWGYHFGSGSLISNPPSAFCGYFTCISSFWGGTGYVVECANGQYSLSGGHRGVCSKQGGELRVLYA